MMARFPGDALAMTTHMIMIADFMLAKSKRVPPRASEGERVTHAEYWRIIQPESWKGT